MDINNLDNFDINKYTKYVDGKGKVDFQFNYKLLFKFLLNENDLETIKLNNQYEYKDILFCKEFIYNLLTEPISVFKYTTKLFQDYLDICNNYYNYDKFKDTLLELNINEATLTKFLSNYESNIDAKMRTCYNNNQCDNVNLLQFNELSQPLFDNFENKLNDDRSKLKLKEIKDLFSNLYNKKDLYAHFIDTKQCIKIALQFIDNYLWSMSKDNLFMDIIRKKIQALIKDNNNSDYTFVLKELENLNLYPLYYGLFTNILELDETELIENNILDKVNLRLIFYILFYYINQLKFITQNLTAIDSTIYSIEILVKELLYDDNLNQQDKELIINTMPKYQFIFGYYFIEDEINYRNIGAICRPKLQILTEKIQEYIDKGLDTKKINEIYSIQQDISNFIIVDINRLLIDPFYFNKKKSIVSKFYNYSLKNNTFLDKYNTYINEILFSLTKYINNIFSENNWFSFKSLNNKEQKELFDKINNQITTKLITLKNFNYSFSLSNLNLKILLFNVYLRTNVYAALKELKQSLLEVYKIKGKTKQEKAEKQKKINELNKKYNNNIVAETNLKELDDEINYLNYRIPLYRPRYCSLIEPFKLKNCSLHFEEYLNKKYNFFDIKGLEKEFNNEFDDYNFTNFLNENVRNTDLQYKTYNIEVPLTYEMEKINEQILELDKVENLKKIEILEKSFNIAEDYLSTYNTNINPNFDFDIKNNIDNKELPFNHSEEIYQIVTKKLASMLELIISGDLPVFILNKSIDLKADVSSYLTEKIDLEKRKAEFLNTNEKLINDVRINFNKLKSNIMSLVNTYLKINPPNIDKNELKNLIELCDYLKEKTNKWNLNKPLIDNYIVFRAKVDLDLTDKYKDYYNTFLTFFSNFILTIKYNYKKRYKDYVNEMKTKYNKSFVVKNLDNFLLHIDIYYKIMYLQYIQEDSLKKSYILNTNISSLIENVMNELYTYLNKQKIDINKFDYLLNKIYQEFRTIYIVFIDIIKKTHYLNNKFNFNIESIKKDIDINDYPFDFKGKIMNFLIDTKNIFGTIYNKLFSYKIGDLENTKSFLSNVDTCSTYSSNIFNKKYSKKFYEENKTYILIKRYNDTKEIEDLSYKYYVLANMLKYMENTNVIPLSEDDKYIIKTYKENSEQNLNIPIQINFDDYFKANGREVYQLLYYFYSILILGETYFYFDSNQALGYIFCYDSKDFKSDNLNIKYLYDFYSKNVNSVIIDLFKIKFAYNLIIGILIKYDENYNIEYNNLKANNELYLNYIDNKDFIKEFENNIENKSYQQIINYMNLLNKYLKVNIEIVNAKKSNDNKKLDLLNIELVHLEEKKLTFFNDYHYDNEIWTKNNLENYYKLINTNSNFKQKYGQDIKVFLLYLPIILNSKTQDDLRINIQNASEEINNEVEKYNKDKNFVFDYVQPNINNETQLLYNSLLDLRNKYILLGGSELKDINIVKNIYYNETPNEYYDDYSKAFNERINLLQQVYKIFNSTEYKIIYNKIMYEFYKINDYLSYKFNVKVLPELKFIHKLEMYWNSGERGLTNFIIVYNQLIKAYDKATKDNINKAKAGLFKTKIKEKLHDLIIYLNKSDNKILNIAGYNLNLLFFAANNIIFEIKNLAEPNNKKINEAKLTTSFLTLDFEDLITSRNKLPNSKYKSADMFLNSLNLKC